MNVFSKCWLIELERLGEPLARGLVDLADRLAGLRDRVEQILALRGEERVARLELVELLDGHHVDRAEAVDLLLEVGDDLLRRERRRLVDGVGRRAGASASASPARLDRFVLVGRGHRGQPLCRRDELAGLFHAGDLGDDVVERRADRFEARGAEVRRDRRLAVARATSDCMTSLRTASSVLRAVRISWSRALN